MIILVSVSFAVCAALAALALHAMNVPVAAAATFVAAGIGFFGWRFFRGAGEPSFWPLLAVWIVTTAMMLAALLVRG